jgi:hypothetical protein
MIDWIPVPEPVTWTLPTPLTAGGMRFTTVTLRAPTAGDVLKATAIPGASALDVTLRLIEAVSAEQVPYEQLKLVPAAVVEQMSAYLDLFGGAPLPDPLEAWQAERRARQAAATALSSGAAAAAS